MTSYHTSNPTPLTLTLSLLALLSCTGLTIALTYLPCHSSMCVEQYFPLQTRIHIGVFYALLLFAFLALTIRRSSIPFRRILDVIIFDTPVPLTGRRLTLGVVGLLVWIAGLSVGSTGYWLPVQARYWNGRGEAVGWTRYMSRVIWTGVTGHWCDIWVGLVLLPVGRRSFLGSALEIRYDTLLFAHKLLGYALCVGGFVHGFLYYSFLAAWVQNVHNRRVRCEFLPDNPLLTWDQAEVKGAYSWFNLPTGAVVGIVLVPVMVITSLPTLRHLNYNTFYFIHTVFAVLVVVLVCLHASTNFYFILPGLLLWIVDWVWRLRHSLTINSPVQLQSAGNGWYRMYLPTSFATTMTSSQIEKGDVILTSEPLQSRQPVNPLQTYHVNIDQISWIQCHPFTAVNAGSVESGPTLLFQKSPERKRAAKRDKEWTWKLAALADQKIPRQIIHLKARVEGPYSPWVPEMFNANSVLAIAGGTGITGALAIADWWLRRSSISHSRPRYLRLVWTIRDVATSHVKELSDLRLCMSSRNDMDLRIHCSKESGRIEASAEILEFLEHPLVTGGKAWMYFSGPEGLVVAAKTACMKQKKLLGQNTEDNKVTELDWYAAKYNV